MTRLKLLVALVTLTLGATAIACRDGEPTPGRNADISELWVEPTDLESRDLFYGAGERILEPDSTARFDRLKDKEHGTNPGYDVIDERGRAWSVKLGREARIEVTLSRIVWAVGYHQPPIYYVRRWFLTDSGDVNEQAEGRFRVEGDSVVKKSEWSWRQNPFVGTRELAGLYALMVIFGNWDLKPEQNVVYEIHSNGATSRRYVVKDLGGALGTTSWLLHTKGDTAGFDTEQFITAVDDSVVTFGRFREGWPDSLRQDVVVRTTDLHWICGLLSRLSDKQWHDAFRAGGFSEAQASRFIRRVKRKVAEGLAG